MFDSDILSGVGAVLATVHQPTELRTGKDKGETDRMLSVLEQIASCNSNVTVNVATEAEVPADGVRIFVDGVDSGIEFRAVPEGNMLGAFLYAVKNSSGFGFTLDKDLLERGAAIDKDIELVTYVGEHSAYTPRVLQVINEIVAVNPRISNVVVDAQERHDLMKRYGIDKLPAVTCNDTLISEGWGTPEDVVRSLERL